MTAAGTENTLTIDANVVQYYILFKNGHPLPPGLRVNRIQDFSNNVIDRHPIAVNEFIRTEYQACGNPETIKNWLKTRLQNNLAIEVECQPLQNHVRVCLRDDYGFDCWSMDARYLQTCLNTIFKHLITENTTHFDRPHRRPRRRSMRNYLWRELSITICTVDECCTIVLDA